MLVPSHLSASPKLIFASALLTNLLNQIYLLTQVKVTNDSLPQLPSVGIFSLNMRPFSSLGAHEPNLLVSPPVEPLPSTKFC